MSIYVSQSGAKYNLGSPIGESRYSKRNTPIEMSDTNPLKPMERDPFGFTMLSYPSDMANFAQNGHYMLFYVNVQNVTKYGYISNKGKRVGGKTLIPAHTNIITQLVPGEGTVQTEVSVPESFVDSKDVAEVAYSQSRVAKGTATQLDSDGNDLYQNPRLPSSGFSQVLRAFNQETATTRVSDSVALYLPPNIEDTYTANYNAHQTGMLGFLAAAGLGGIKAWREGDMGELAKIATGAGFGFLDYAAKKAALSAAEFAAGAEGGEELFNKAFARADNPYMEVLFDKVHLREFSYNFTFVPRNAKEQDEVKRIIQLFRFHMAPELRQDHGRFITLPSEFDIHYMYQAKDGEATENDFYNKIATCVLSECKVNYTPDGVRSHADGSPVHITMALTFKETETITKEKIDQGY